MQGLLASSPGEALGFGRKELTKEGRILSIFNIVEYGSETGGLNAGGVPNGEGSWREDVFWFRTGRYLKPQLSTPVK